MTSSISSGLKTSDAAIAVGRNRVNSILLITDGTNAATLVVYDNASAASGVEVAKVTAAGTQNTVQVVFDCPVRVEEGIYADVTGTGAAYIVHYGG